LFVTLMKDQKVVCSGIQLTPSHLLHTTHPITLAGAALLPFLVCVHEPIKSSEHFGVLANGHKIPRGGHKYYRVANVHGHRLHTAWAQAAYCMGTGCILHNCMWCRYTVD
jgi:hypothetical protein